MQRAFQGIWAVVNAWIVENPDDPVAQDWLDGSVDIADASVRYGWANASPAALESVYRQLGSSTPDKAIRFVILISEIWEVPPPEVDVCLAQHALALLIRPTDRPDDLREKAAIELFARIERLSLWASVSLRAKTWRGEIEWPQGEAEEWADLETQIIFSLLMEPGATRESLVSTQLIHEPSGREYTVSQKTAMHEALEPQVWTDLEVAKPFIDNLRELLALPYADAVRTLF
ncbi:MAG: hypothetical protein AAGE80_19755 [Pseudomonadota bacterium]